MKLTYDRIASLAVELGHKLLVLLPLTHAPWGFQVGFICAVQ